MSCALAGLAAPAAAHAGDPVVAAAGDIACDPTDAGFNTGAGTSSRCRQRHVSELLMGGELSAVLPLGDAQYEDGELTKFRQSFDPSWGRVRNLMRPVAGNHEYRDHAAAGYFDYFNGEGIATGPAGTRGKGYYSFDIGTWHLVALNSNCAEVGGCGVGSAQERWLRSDLAVHSNQCTLAYLHAPRFSSGSHGDTTEVSALWSALYGAGTDVVLAGHDHHYERFARQDPHGRPDLTRGIRSFVVGTGGKSLRSVTRAAANSQVRSSSAFGVLRLTLRGGGYEWRFQPEAGSAFTDTGRETCISAKPDPTPSSRPILGAPQPAFAPVGAAPTGVTRVLSRRVRVGRGRARLRVRCVASANQRCAGQLTLRTSQRVRVRGRRVRVLVGRRRVEMSPGATKSVNVLLSRRSRRILVRTRRLRVRAQVTGPRADGSVRRIEKTLLLLAARGPRR
jgi:acid phosphatase type 7